MIIRNANVLDRQLNFRNSRILENFETSGLTSERYLRSCGQYLHERRFNKNFAALNAAAQEDCLLQKYDYTNVTGLVDILKKYENITLTEVYSILNRTALRSGFRKNETLLKITADMDDMLFVGAEACLGQILSLCSTDKKITIWVNDDIICDVLSFDFKDSENITIKSVDIFDNTKQEESKFENIFYFPQFRAKKQFRRGSYFGNDIMTVSVELLMKNLSKGGVLTTILPSRINFSDMEVHFRQYIGNNIIKVVSLPEDTLKNTAIKAYLYKFGTELTDTIYISNNLDDEGTKVDSKSVRNGDKDLNLFWDFEKVLKPADEDILNISEQNPKKLSEIAEVLRGKPLSVYAILAEEDTALADKNTKKFIYLDLRSVTENGIKFSEAQEYKLKRHVELPFLKKGDLLIPNKGNLSKVVLFDSDKDCVASSNLFIIRPKNKITSEYLLMYLRSEIGKKIIANIQRTTNIPIINHEDLKNIPIVVPKPTVQKSIAEKYNLTKKEYIEQIETIQNKIDELDEKLSKYLCGKIKEF